MLQESGNLSFIDLILTNNPNPNSFQKAGVTKTDLSYLRKMTVTLMKATFQKLKANHTF